MQRMHPAKFPARLELHRGVSRWFADYNNFNRSICCALDLDDNGFVARRSSGGVIFIAIEMMRRHYGPVPKAEAARR